MKFIISFFALFIMSGPVAADEFGSRFSENSPAGLVDPSPEALAAYRAEALQAIVPAAGDNNEEQSDFELKNKLDEPVAENQGSLIEGLKRLEFK